MRLISGIRAYLASSPIPMRTVLLAAGLLSVLFVFTSFIGRTELGTHISRFDWWIQAPIPFLNFFTWALVLPLVNQWTKKWPLNNRPLWRPFLFHFSLGLLLCTFHEAFSNLLYVVVLNESGRISWQPSMLNGVLLSLPGGIVQRFMEYWLLLVLLMYTETQRQVREERTRVLQLQNELQTTQLLALKKQLQPHFLYNTLNTVSALMDVDNKSARTVLSRLGELLRTTLDEERRERVTLIHEVDHVGNYLGIETIRFKDRLQVRYDIPSECQSALVPGMVLQPLVENSIKHGLDATSDEVRIDIVARRDQGNILLTVSDNGKGCADVSFALSNGGIGLRNVRQRLTLLHGNKGKFEAVSEEGGGFRVSLGFPYEVADRSTGHE
ncbi:MAG: histidine kinase [Flavobacteriales bacterium]|jgi:sensor histidine kinase YesM|nr:histidine kinase [Flavobacteriales bacterium]